MLKYIVPRRGVRFASTWDAFNVNDVLNMKSQLTQTEVMVMESARSFAQKKLQPVVTDMYRNESFDRKLMREMGEAGLLGSTIDGYGCSGISYVGYGLIAREVERVDSGFRSAMSVQSSLVMHPIYKFGSEEQKERYLPGLASGELVGCFGLTEPNHGSDPSGMETVAELQSNGDYILRGSKLWITNAPLADVFVVWAKEIGTGASGKVRGFVLDRNQKGLTTQTIKGKISLRASTTGAIYMDDVRIPASCLLPKSTSIASAFSCLNSARLGIAWGAMGAAEACFDRTREYVMDRKQFGAPLASNQLVQKHLADMLCDITLGLNGALQATKMKDAWLAQHGPGEGLHPSIVSLLKKNNCAKAFEIAVKCRDMLGANGISDEYHVARHLTNLMSVITYEGTDSMHTLILGKEITGIDAFTPAESYRRNTVKK